jgi:hypothetical protein
VSDGIALPQGSEGRTIFQNDVSRPGPRHSLLQGVVYATRISIEPKSAKRDEQENLNPVRL